MAPESPLLALQREAECHGPSAGSFIDVGSPPKKKGKKQNTFFWGGRAGFTPLKCDSGPVLLNFFSISIVFVVMKHSTQKISSAAAEVAQRAASPLAGLWRQLTAGEVGDLCLESREIDMEIYVGGLVHRALEAVEAKEKEPKAHNLKEAGVCLSLAAAKLKRKAAKHPFKLQKAKLDLADELEELGDKTKELASMYELCGVDGADELAAEADRAEAAAATQALEATVRVQIKGHRDAIVEGLRSRWGAELAHEGLVEFLIEGKKSTIARLAGEAGIRELGSARLYGGKTVTIGASFVVPTRFAASGSVGPNVFLFKKVEGQWVAITGSAVNKNDLETVLLYRLVKKAVNGRADIKETIRALLLKSLEASASAWHAVLSKGDYTLEVLLRERESSTVGLGMYQLAIVPATESMTPELAETMALIKTNMTKGVGSVARYFTMWERDSSGRISLAGEVPVAGKRKSSETSETSESVEAVEALVRRVESGELRETSKKRRLQVEVEQAKFEELVGVVRSAKSTEEEYAVAAKEIERREKMCLAIRHILVGNYKMPHKDRSYSGYVGFSSDAAEVRNETIEEIARFAFSDEDAKTLSAALTEILCALGFCGGAGGAGQASDGAMSLTKLCGLSAQHGPELVGLGEYLLLVESKAPVDAIIGTALKAKLRSMGPEHWDFGDESDEEADEDSEQADEAQVEGGCSVKRSRGRDESMAVD